MSLVTITTNVPEINALLGRLFRDQIPFATSRAINDVAKLAQEKQRKHQRKIFTVRRPQFVDKAVKIKPFASKRSLSAIIQIAPPGGAKTRDILTKFETDRTKRPRDGRSIAVPVNVKRTAAGVVRKNLRPRALNLRKHGGAGRVLRGDRRTFLIRNAAGGGGGIFQRFGGKGSTEVRLLFALVPRVSITPDLEFLDNVTQIVNTRFADRFSLRFDEAIRSAR